MEQGLHQTMADHQGHVRLMENELRTTETLREDDFANWESQSPLPREKKLHPEYRRWPYFTKRVMKGSTHHTPQSVICVPTPFMRQHPDTFQAGNLITLEGPSGNTWRVRASDKPIIHSGWRAFSHDHDLRVGDRLCFNLTHRSRFVVEVLDGNGEVKRSALSATNTGKYTVASIANPCEYVRRPRKRKRTTVMSSKTPRRSRDAFGYGPTIASRCKTTARRRNSNDYPVMAGVRLRFSDTTKQWECHEETGGREVVTILDSDDDQAEEPDNHLVDRHIKLSFGSAQVQSYKTSKIQRLVQYMQTHQIAIAGDDQTTPATAGESENINHQANPIPQVEIQLKASRTDPALPCQAQGSGDEAMMHNLEEDETHLIEGNVEVGNRSEPNHGADPEASLQPLTLPPTPEGEAADAHESHVTIGPLIDQAPVSPSEELATSNAAEAAGGEFLFATLQSIVDMPVIADTTNEGQNRDSVQHPLMRDLIIQELAQKNFDQAEVELHVNMKGKDAEHEDSMLKPGYGYGYVASGNTEVDETKQQYLHFLQPPKATVGHPRRHLEFKQFLNNATVTDSEIGNLAPDGAHEKNHLLQEPARDSLLSAVKDHVAFPEICVLQSKRGKVANLDREKTLKAAQAWTKKLRNPNFVAVMKTSNVYHDFVMDIPGEFAKKSRLPATATRAMLICDEVPTMCRAVWEGAGLNAHGWMEFSRTHYLEEGDVCVFELHNRVAVRIGVHIFRVVGLRRSLVDWAHHYHVVNLGTQHAPHQLSFSEAGSTRAAALQVL